jgi:hypothetical protein
MPVSARRVSGELRLTLRNNPFVDSGERAYAFAKACGIIGKSFVGKRIVLLKKLQSLNELDRLVFPEAGRELPGRELLADLERRILQRTTRQILAVIDSFSEPPQLLIRQLRSCEYSDLKTCLHHISGGKTDLPVLNDIGRFRTVRFKAYPDFAAMLTGTEFEFTLAKDLSSIKSASHDLTPLEAELDLRYYTLLVQSLSGLSAEDCLLAWQILADEISLRNCVWALRLRTYFKKKPDETAAYLMDIKMPVSSAPAAISGAVHIRKNPNNVQSPDSGKEISLAAEAYELLDFPLDTRSAWKNWRWKCLLNPEKPGAAWSADPRYFQNAASQYIYRLSLRCFRLMPFSVSSGFCYIKLKQFEEDLLTSVTEGLGLGMNGNDVFNLLEVSA